MNVLAFGVHPDDWEAMTAGTLSKYKRQGSRISIAILTDGAAGGFSSPAIVRQMREREARQAAALLEADFEWLGIPDTALCNNRQTLKQIIATIRRAKPDVILAPSKNDSHRDHYHGACLIDEATYMVGVPSIVDSAPPCPPPRVYAMEPFWSVDYQPLAAEYVELSAEDFALKMAILACHQSQIKWLWEHDHIDLLAMVERKTRFRGSEAGVELAEIFFRFPHWPIPTRRWLP